MLYKIQLPSDLRAGSYNCKLQSEGAFSGEDGRTLIQILPFDFVDRQQLTDLQEELHEALSDLQDAFDELEHCEEKRNANNDTVSTKVKAASGGGSGDRKDNPGGFSKPTPPDTSGSSSGSAGQLDLFTEQ